MRRLLHVNISQQAMGGFRFYQVGRQGRVKFCQVEKRSLRPNISSQAIAGYVCYFCKNLYFFLLIEAALLLMTTLVQRLPSWHLSLYAIYVF